MSDILAEATRLNKAIRAQVDSLGDWTDADLETEGSRGSWEDRIQACFLFNNIMANRRIRSYFSKAASQVIPEDPKEELFAEYLVPGLESSDHPELEEVQQWLEAHRSVSRIVREMADEKRSAIASLLAYDK